MGNHQSSTCSNEQRRRTRSGIGRSGGPYVFDASGEGGTQMQTETSRWTVGQMVIWQTLISVS